MANKNRETLAEFLDRLHKLDPRRPDERREYESGERYVTCSDAYEALYFKSKKEAIAFWRSKRKDAN